MKSTPASGTLFTVTLLLTAAALGCMSRSSVAAGDAQTVTSTFTVEGMTCGGCELGVEMKVSDLDGVVSVEASYEKGLAGVVHDPEEVTPDEIVAAIEELGYSAQLQEAPEDGADADRAAEVPS